MVKALAAGARCGNDGSVFAGLKKARVKPLFMKEENLKNTVAWVHIGAMQQGSSDRYFQDVEDDIKKFVPEGIEGRVAYKGNLAEVVHNI